MTHRSRATQQRVHYQGLLNINLGTGEYTKHYVLLKDHELCLFDSEKDVKAGVGTNLPGQRIPLSGMTSVSFDVSKRVRDMQSTFPTISIESRSQSNNVRIRAFNKPDQERLFRYLHVIIMKRLPDNISNMLPGQVKELEDILEQVQSSNVRPMSLSDLPGTPSLFSPPAGHISPMSSAHVFPYQNPPQGATVESPKWLFDKPLSRETAEEILRTNAQHGNLIVRQRDVVPDDGYKYAVSVKVSNVEDYKHYRVSRSSLRGLDNFQIHLGGKMHPNLSSFHELVQYFVQESSGIYTPLSHVSNLPNHVYNQSLTATTINSPMSRRNSEMPHYNNIQLGRSLPTAAPRRLPPAHSMSMPVLPLNGFMLEEEPGYLS